MSDVAGLQEFLKDYPGMALGPSRHAATVIRGVLSFSAAYKGGPTITDSYRLELVVPDAFPRELPRVTETGKQIPRDGRHHVNPDGTLCLGSPLRLLKKISDHPGLVGFAERCLVPYLYAVSHIRLNGGVFVFSELAHGEPGIVADYMDLFGLKTRAQVVRAVTLLGMKRRIANKSPCPCDCGLRLGKCRLHYKLNKFRKVSFRSRFKAHAANLGGGM